MSKTPKSTTPTSSKSKIVIYKGTFDPLHNGHKAIISELYNKFDEIYIVPIKINYNTMFTDNARLSFIADYVMKCYPTLNKIHIISDALHDETDKLLKTFNLINHITSKYLNKIENEIYLCIGWDEYKDLKKWNEYEKILKNVKLVVVNRDDSKFENLYPELNENVINIEIHGYENIS